MSVAHRFQSVDWKRDCQGRNRVSLQPRSQTLFVNEDNEDKLSSLVPEFVNEDNPCLPSTDY